VGAWPAHLEQDRGEEASALSELRQPASPRSARLRPRAGALSLLRRAAQAQPTQDRDDLAAGGAPEAGAAAAGRLENSALLGLLPGADATRPDSDVLALAPGAWSQPAPPAPRPAPLPAPIAPPEPIVPIPAEALFDPPVASESGPPSEISPAPAIEAPLEPEPDLEALLRPGRRRAWVPAGVAALLLGPTLLVLGWKLATERRTPPAADVAPPATATPTDPAPAPAPSPIGQIRQPLLQPPADPDPPAAPEETPAAAVPVAPRVDDAEPAVATARAVETRRRRHPRRGRQAAATAAVVSTGAGRVAYDRGNQRLFSGDSAGAIAAYREAIVQDPREAAGYRGLGLAHAERGERAEALRYLKQYLKMAPRAPDRSLITKRMRHLRRSRP
jgi:tetratricopeptide (TPR) repeat protein